MITIHTVKKYSLLILALILLTAQNTTNALAGTRNDLHIIPESATDTGTLHQQVQEVGDYTKPGTVISRYNEQAGNIEKSKDLGAAFATGIFSWNLIFLYISHIIKFLSQLGLLIGGIMILYAGYLYAGTIFGFWDANGAKAAINNALKGILVIIFSYAILKGLTSMFIS